MSFFGFEITLFVQQARTEWSVQLSHTASFQFENVYFSTNSSFRMIVRASVGHRDGEASHFDFDFE